MFLSYDIVVLIIEENHLLLGHRANNFKRISEPDIWTLPSGGQNYNESIFECAIRVTKEKTNLDLDENDLRVIDICDDYQNGRYFKRVHVLAQNCSGKLRVMENSKIDKWQWCYLNNLPENIYLPSQKVIDEYFKTKRK